MTPPAWWYWALYVYLALLAFGVGWLMLDRYLPTGAGRHKPTPGPVPPPRGMRVRVPPADTLPQQLPADVDPLAWLDQLRDDVKVGNGVELAGPAADVAAEPEPEWCGRRWHDGTCCPASAAQYAEHPDPYADPAAPIVAAATDVARQLGAAVAVRHEPAPAPVAELPMAARIREHRQRIQALDKLSPAQLLDVTVQLAGWEPELVDQALALVPGRGE